MLSVSPLLPSSVTPLGPLPDSSILWCQKWQLLKQSLTQLVPYRVQRGADPALIQTDIKGKLEAFLADPQLSGKKAAAWLSWLGIFHPTNDIHPRDIPLWLLRNQESSGTSVGFLACWCHEGLGSLALWHCQPIEELPIPSFLMAC